MVVHFGDSKALESDFAKFQSEQDSLYSTSRALPMGHDFPLVNFFAASDLLALSVPELGQLKQAAR